MPFNLIFSFLLFLSGPSAIIPAPEAADGVVTWLDGQDHDFGELPQGRPRGMVFRFRNISDAPILLQTVRTTCGCTAARWTETPVEPGATGEVSIEYDALQAGDFSKKIRVFFDRQRKPEILWIRGTVN
jgi:hypothetical protein